MQYKKNSSLLSCCNIEEVDDKNSYEKMNNKAVKYKNIVKILTEVVSEDGVDNNTNEKNSKNNEGINDENKSNNHAKEIKINKKTDILLLNKNNEDSNSNINQNMKTIPKEINEKKEKKENEKREENKDDNNKEIINDSIDVDEENNDK